MPAVAVAIIVPILREVLAETSLRQELLHKFQDLVVRDLAQPAQVAGEPQRGLTIGPVVAVVEAMPVVAGVALVGRRVTPTAVVAVAAAAAA